MLGFSIRRYGLACGGEEHGISADEPDDLESLKAAARVASLFRSNIGSGRLTPARNALSPVSSNRRTPADTVRSGQASARARSIPTDRAVISAFAAETRG